MMRIHARELAAMDRDKLWALPDEDLIIIFDDGQIQTDQRKAVWSAYVWGFYTLLPHTPALKGDFIGDTRMGTDTHLVYINKIRWRAYDAYAEMGQHLDNEEMSRLALIQVNEYYNDMTERLEPYVTTLETPDLIEVLEQPEIMEANIRVGVSNKSVVHAHRTVERALKEDAKLSNNILSRSVRSGLVKLGQVLQCIGPRGSVTDIDSNIFPYPTQTGFALGLYRFYDSLVESRTGSKALKFTEKPLQDTEYFNRRLQILAASIKDIFDGDCGTSQYLKWHVASGDMAALAGKYYLKDDGSLDTIYNNDGCRSELVGKTIQIRSILHCNTPDSGAVCATCYGELQHSIPHETNIGHVGATSLCKQASQSVLSTKHLDTSASSSGLRLSDFERRYVVQGNDPNLMFLNPRWEGMDVKMFVRGHEAKRLSEVKVVEDTDLLLPTHVSSLTQVTFKINDPKKKDPIFDIVQVSNGSRTSSLSKEMLLYLKASSWKLTSDGDIEIDLKKWDAELPIFSTPNRQENMLDYMNTIEKFLKAVKRKVKKPGDVPESLQDFDDPDSALRGFYELVSSRLFVNLVHLELLVKVCQVRSADDRDFRVPLLGNKWEVGKFDQNIFNRSMGASMAYQNHKQQWNTPATYLTHLRPSHPLDTILLPRPDQL